jgi:hypothetical protein
MTNITLAQSYLIKALKRLKILIVLLDEKAYSDVVREAQEIVELSLKAMLRNVGIEPPKWHDVGKIVQQYRDRFRNDTSPHVDRLADISAWLRKEREFFLRNPCQSARRRSGTDHFVLVPEVWF